MTKDQITAIINHFASLPAVIRNAEPADKAEIYKGRVCQDNGVTSFSVVTCVPR
jgi:hypothetical protein